MHAGLPIPTGPRWLGGPKTSVALCFACRSSEETERREPPAVAPQIRSHQSYGIRSEGVPENTCLTHGQSARQMVAIPGGHPASLTSPSADYMIRAHRSRGYTRAVCDRDDRLRDGIARHCLRPTPQTATQKWTSRHPLPPGLPCRLSLRSSQTRYQWVLLRQERHQLQRLNLRANLPFDKYQ